MRIQYVQLQKPLTVRHTRPGLIDICARYVTGGADTQDPGAQPMHRPGLSLSPPIEPVITLPFATCLTTLMICVA